MTIKDVSVDAMADPVLEDKISSLGNCETLSTAAALSDSAIPDSNDATLDNSATLEVGDELEVDIEDIEEVVEEIVEEAVEEVNGITFFSAINNLQTNLLANLITAQTQLPCVVETRFDTRNLSHVSLVIVDCQGRGLDELQNLVRKIQNHKTELRAVLLNAIPESEHEELLDWPCIVGVFFDDTDQEQLNRGLTSMLAGEYWVPRRLLHLFFQKNRRAPSSRKLDIKLTKRERQILKLIKNGATNLDIAKVLDVSEHTIKSHLYNVYKKIGVRNRLEANNWVRDIDTL